MGPAEILSAASLAFCLYTTDVLVYDRNQFCVSNLAVLDEQRQSYADDAKLCENNPAARARNEMMAQRASCQFDINMAWLRQTWFRRLLSNPPSLGESMQVIHD